MKSTDGEQTGRNQKPAPIKYESTPGNEKNISSAEEWTAAKRREAEELIQKIDGVSSASVVKGSKGRPLDAIYVLTEREMDSKILVRTVEILLKNVMTLTIDYRIVAVRTDPRLQCSPRDPGPPLSRG